MGCVPLLCLSSIQNSRQVPLNDAPTYPLHSDFLSPTERGQRGARTGYPLCRSRFRPLCPPRRPSLPPRLKSQMVVLHPTKSLFYKGSLVAVWSSTSSRRPECTGDADPEGEWRTKGRGHLGTTMTQGSQSGSSPRGRHGRSDCYVSERPGVLVESWTCIIHESF